KGRWLEQLRRKMSRVAKLAESGIPCGPKPAEGFFVHFIGHNQVQVSFRAFSQGQQRMKMDPQAPSRSYLKLEEAFHIFGSEPQAGETVVDLGAAPGGWTYSALKRGALVTAVDNGPLKEPVLSHSGVLHLRTDALKYQPESGGCVDWLLCDVLEQPDFILNLLKRWLGEQRCRRFVVNLKIGRTDPIPVLRDILDNRRGIAQHCSILKVRQLYHDREEITLMGDARV
ncbi:MAG: rRNA methyltransferase, partial [Candidatus Omnitrophica bacterium]|nr:rRNA methyltransferase [Candidatus Omnitrophota bacterium]